MTGDSVSDAAKVVERRNAVEVQGGGNFDVFDARYNSLNGLGACALHRRAVAEAERTPERARCRARPSRRHCEPLMRW